MEAVKLAVQNGQIPGVAMLAKDVTGRVDYAECYGAGGVAGVKAHQPMQLDTVCGIASASKLITSIAAMQCVERGTLSLNDDVLDPDSELYGLTVIDHVQEDGKPILRPLRTKLTLRHLLSHSSGFCYDVMHPHLVAYRQSRNEPCLPDTHYLKDRYHHPLVYDPGAGWSYGPGIDWVGRMVEQATGMKLEKYVQHNICAPMSIRDMTFKLQTRQDMVERRADMSVRDDKGLLKPKDEAFWHQDLVDDFGGQGIFTTPEAFMKVMWSLLVNDGKLLQPQTVELMFEPQLSTMSQKQMMSLYASTEMNAKMGGLLPIGAKRDYSLVGAVLLEDLDEDGMWRRKGTVFWSGLPNVFWFIDRAAGLCGLYFSQLEPPGDDISLHLARTFERNVYSRLRNVNKKHEL